MLLNASMNTCVNMHTTHKREKKPKTQIMVKVSGHIVKDREARDKKLYLI